MVFLFTSEVLSESKCQTQGEEEEEDWAIPCWTDKKIQSSKEEEEKNPQSLRLTL